MKLSLIVPYRDRRSHLNAMLSWFEITTNLNSKIELIIVESSKKPSLNSFSGDQRINYIHVAGEGNFNKSKLLNIGLRKARGKFLVPYDVDLVPVDPAFNLHLRLVQSYENGLITGYRLLYHKETIQNDEIKRAILDMEIAKEDYYVKFLKDQLVGKQRYGVLPFFKTEKLRKIGGWDEQFVGWGGEDQDIIERYLTGDNYLLRCPDLLYIHLYHKNSEGWNDTNLTSKNLERYHMKRNTIDIK